MEAAQVRPPATWGFPGVPGPTINCSAHAFVGQAPSAESRCPPFRVATWGEGGWLRPNFAAPRRRCDGWRWVQGRAVACHGRVAPASDFLSQLATLGERNDEYA